MKTKTRVIAIANQKGGVGKTTTALCLASSLARRGRRVLMVDLDQQANATRTYGAVSDGHATTYDILLGDVQDATDAVQRTEHGDIVPGDILLSGAEAEMASMPFRETRLADAFEGIVSSGDYDYVLVDCSPSLGIVTTNALVLAGEVLVPVLVDGYSIDGLDKLAKLVDFVRSNRRIGHEVRISGLLVCQGEKSQRLSRAFEEQLPGIAGRYGTRVYDTWIRRCAKVREAQARNMFLSDYASLCTSSVDYDCLAEEIDLGQAR